MYSKGDNTIQYCTILYNTVQYLTCRAYLFHPHQSLMVWYMFDWDVGHIDHIDHTSIDHVDTMVVMIVMSAMTDMSGMSGM
jgi:hypothetical protein